MRKLITMLTFTALMTLLLPPLCQAEVSALNRFGVDQVRRMGSRNEGNENVIFSPAATYAGFELLAQGAGGATKEGLNKLLSPNGGQIASVLGQIPVVDAKEQAYTGGGIGLMSFAIMNPRGELKAEFAQSLKSLHTATVTPAEPNDWLNSLFRFADEVQNRSGKMVIISVPTATVNSHSDFVLATGMLFDASWQNPFDPTATKNEIFYAPTTETVRVPMMHRVADKDGTRYLENEVAQVVELPFAAAGGAHYAMDIVLPKTGYEELVVGDALSGQNIDVWTQFVSTPTAPIHIAFPKFTAGTSGELWYDAGLTGTLSEHGDFSALSACPNPVVALQQSLDISFSEFGVQTTVAGPASKTAATADMIEFNANRPFYFQIRDTSKNIVLLSGLMRNPAAGGC